MRRSIPVLVALHLCGRAYSQASEGGASKGAWGAAAPYSLQANCSGAWTAWTACSPSARQTKFFEPTRWAANGGTACPSPLKEEQGCGYPGPQLLYASSSRSVLWQACQCVKAEHAMIQAAVGDSIVFSVEQGTPKIVRMASTWHYSRCDETGSENVPLDLATTTQGVLLPNMFTYVIRETDSGRSVYFSGDECARGQRVRVEVEAFQHGTLSVVMDLLGKEAYATERGARVMVERLWCMIEHCPNSSVSYYLADYDVAKRLWKRDLCLYEIDTRTVKDAYTYMKRGLVFNPPLLLQMHFVSEYNYSEILCIVQCASACPARNCVWSLAQFLVHECCSLIHNGSRAYGSMYYTCV